MNYRDCGVGKGDNEADGDEKEQGKRDEGGG